MILVSRKIPHATELYAKETDLISLVIFHVGVFTNLGHNGIYVS